VLFDKFIQLKTGERQSSGLTRLLGTFRAAHSHMEASMLLKNSMRSLLTKRLTKTSRFVLENKVPLVSQKIQEIDALGLYLHIPSAAKFALTAPTTK
jgi:hypothetical protein